MGSIYNIPYVGELVFDNTGYNTVSYSNLNDAQKSAVDIITSRGVRYSQYEWMAAAGYNNYIGFYVSGNSYYVGYSFIDGNVYTSYRNALSVTVNASTETGGVYISNYAHAISDLPTGVDTYNSREELNNALTGMVLYPITYHYTNSIVSGPSSAIVGETIIVSAVPDVGYGITDASTQILVTNDDVAVPYTWDATNQRITFTMSEPIENRGGFGSTGQ